MKINEPVYYLKIVQAMDDIVKPKNERIIYGDAAQYQLLKRLAIEYTAKENCLALVGFVTCYLPEKAYFEGKELLIDMDERDNVVFQCVKNGRVHTLEHTTVSYYLQDASERENY